MGMLFDGSIRVFLNALLAVMVNEELGLSHAQKWSEFLDQYGADQDEDLTLLQEAVEELYSCLLAIQEMSNLGISCRSHISRAVYRALNRAEEQVVNRAEATRNAWSKA